MVDRGLRGVMGVLGCLLAALALEVVHRIDRNRVTAHAVNVVHGDPPSTSLNPRLNPRGEFPLYNRNATDVIPLDVVILCVSRLSLFSRQRPTFLADFRVGRTEQPHRRVQTR